MFGGRDYSPTELLDFCKVDRFESNYDGPKYFTTQILSLMVTEKDPNLLVEKIEKIIRQVGEVSIGQSLRRLHTIATIGNEFQGGLDGLDALTYHLGGDSCTKAISALQAVMQRFKEDEEERAKQLKKAQN